MYIYFIANVRTFVTRWHLGLVSLIFPFIHSLWLFLPPLLTLFSLACAHSTINLFNHIYSQAVKHFKSCWIELRMLGRKKFDISMCHLIDCNLRLESWSTKEKRAKSWLQIENERLSSIYTHTHTRTHQRQVPSGITNNLVKSSVNFSSTSFFDICMRRTCVKMKRLNENTQPNRSTTQMETHDRRLIASVQ